MECVIYLEFGEEIFVLPGMCVRLHNRQPFPSVHSHPKPVLFPKMCSNHGSDSQGCVTLRSDSNAVKLSSPNILTLSLSHTHKLSKAFINHHMRKLSMAISCLSPQDMLGIF